MTVLNLSGFRRLRLVRQSEATECGLACLAMVSGFHGLEIDLANLRQRFAVSMKGITLEALMGHAAALGLSCRPVRVELTELAELRTPAILHWDLKHFVVLRRVRGNLVDILDPATGVRTLRLEQVSRHFSGVALELTPTGQFQRNRQINPLKLGTLVRFPPETLPALGKALVLSLAIECFLLAAPFYMQVVIDQVVAKGDAGLLTALAVGFGLLALFRVAGSALRGLVFQFLSNVLSFDMEARLLHHLVRLPLDWFQKRQVGDVQSRFMAITPIQQFISSGALKTLLDGGLSLVTGTVMFYLSPMLATIVLASVLLIATMRLSSLELSKRVAADLLVTEAREQTRFLETLRAIQVVKLSAGEARREAVMQNLMADAQNAGIRSGNVEILFSTLSDIISGLTDVLVIYIAALVILDGEFTVGFLTAFLAYKGQFVGRAVALVESLIQWRLLGVQLERLADIALAPREPNNPDGYADKVEGAVEAVGLRFSYAPTDPDVLGGISFRIEPGEFVALVGPSGCGKSTLLRVLTGLYAPRSGEVRVDGRPLWAWDTATLRRQVGVVMQDDQLLAGTIAENIAGFDSQVDRPWVAEVAKLACIHDDITNMPMGYQSLVGDLGSALSGGQKQRVLIARALYKRPRILVMDEGTSNLDVDTERAVNAALSGLGITRIVVAHRPETIHAAERVIQLARPRALGTVVPREPFSPRASDPLRTVESAGEESSAAILN